MGQFITLAADPGGRHEGTGSHQRTVTILQPSSVGSPASNGILQFTSIPNVKITSLLYQLFTPGEPDWFGIAVPQGVTDFSRVHVFFHPIPGQGNPHYYDSDYTHKADPTYVYPTNHIPWSQLFYLVERLGYQSAASAQPMVMIMPFLTSRLATDPGSLLGNWDDIFSAILTDCRNLLQGPSLTPVTVSEMVVSSHSVGISYSDKFRNSAGGLSPVLKAVWDFDGFFSTSKSLSESLVSTANYRAVKYNQGGGDPSFFQLPSARWTSFPTPTIFPPYLNDNDLHHMIRDFLAVHAATLLP